MKQLKRLISSLVPLAAAAGLLVAGCAPAAAPSPTTPPAPTKAAAPAAAPAPTQAAAPAPTAPPPTAAPAKVAFPEKGKPITLIMPWGAGSSNDLAARLLAPEMEKVLGVPVQVVNKTGASSVIALTDLVKSKPDGYTIAWTTSPSTHTTYLDPSLQATYTRKDLVPIALIGLEPIVVVVKGDSPYKTAKDLIDAAKAKPEQIKVGTTGLKSSPHLALALWEKLAGVRFGYVHFVGGAEAIAAVLGGHIDVYGSTPSIVVSHFNSGTLRVLGTMETQENENFPGVKTFRDQGWDVQFGVEFGISAPRGTPKEIVEVLSQAVKKSTESPALRAKFKETARIVRYLDTPDYEALWDKYDVALKPILAEISKQ